MHRPYRGQRVQRRRQIRNIILILLALFLIAGTVFLLFFQDLVNASGRKPLEPQNPPAVQNNDQSGQGQSPKDPDSGATQDNAGQAQNQPSAPVSTVAKLLEIPADKLADPAYLAQVQSLYQQGAINGAAVVVKNPDGSLIWKTAFAEVKNTAIDKNAGDALTAAIATLKSGGLPVTAVLYAYEDDMYGGLNQNAVLMSTTGKAWRSPQGIRRLNPGSDAANAYLSALIQELHDMGCSEVMLRGFGWPAIGSGRLDRVVYGNYSDASARSAKLAETLGAFQSVAQDMKISVCVDNPTAENGFEQGSGQNLAVLSPVAARIYIPMVVQTETSGESIRAIIGQIPGADVSKLVPMYTSAQLAKNLFSGSGSLYFSPSETNGDLSSYLAQ